MIAYLLSIYMRQAARHTMRMRAVGDPFNPSPGLSPPALLYVHVPFCETLCPYCTFHRIPFESRLAARYFVALKREAERYKDLGFDFRDVYVGGGTPTVMPAALADFLDHVRGLWPIKTISVETHANHLTGTVLDHLERARINRLSVGVQTFDDRLLDGMSRLKAHGTGREARDRLLQVKGRFPTLNVDMIFNLPGQTSEMLEDDIRTIVELEVDQATFYPLMGSDQHGWRETASYAALRRESRFFRQIIAGLRDAYAPVSAWCFARDAGSTDEYIVEHDTYVGLGSGAFGFTDGVLYGNTYDVPRYVEALTTRSELPIVARKPFGRTDQMRYDLLMRLFGRSLTLDALPNRYGRIAWPALWKEFLFLFLSGSLKRDGRRLLPTSRGQYYVIIMMKAFFYGVNRMRRFMSAKAGPRPSP